MGSQHHQLCGCCNFQLIQSHAAPSHGPPARVLSPLSSWQSLSCCLSCMVLPIHSRTVWTSTYLLASEPRGPLLQNCMALSSLHQSCLILSLLPQNLVALLLFTCFRTLWFFLSMAVTPRFKSQCSSSFAAPFLTPPTVSYTCQHPGILPALLGCHSKPGQVWPHGMEPIISTLSCRPCNQRELLPSPTLGGIRFHPPGSKHGHSYLTHP